MAADGPVCNRRLSAIYPPAWPNISPPLTAQPVDHRRTGIRAFVPYRGGTALRDIQPALRAGSTLVTTNLPFDEWTEVFGSERLTGALLDRLTHHVHILEMNGESYRLKRSRQTLPRRRLQKSPATLSPPVHANTGPHTPRRPCRQSGPACQASCRWSTLPLPFTHSLHHLLPFAHVELRRVLPAVEVERRLLR